MTEKPFKKGAEIPERSPYKKEIDRKPEQR
jgi:hypothetical protein